MAALRADGVRPVGLATVRHPGVGGDEIRRHRVGVVGRRTERENDLEVTGIRLRQDLAHGVTKVSTLVEDGDDHAHRRLSGGAVLGAAVGAGGGTHPADHPSAGRPHSHAGVGAPFCFRG